MQEQHSGFILHGAVVYSRDQKHLECFEDGYVVCVDGLCEGVYKTLPDEYANLPIEDHWDKLIIPGMVDLHVHAPQYQIRGFGMDCELMDWLEKYAFPEEANYGKREYSERAYDQFVEELYTGPTTRAVIFATKYVSSTVMLMNMLEDTGLVSYVGKVNMDRNVPDYYVESTEKSIESTKKWLFRVKRGFKNTKPILTPRFTPACSKELMDALGNLAADGKIPVQSHLSENRTEIELVRSMEPDSANYADTYERSGLLGGCGRSVMAHCVWCNDDEITLMKKNGTFIAHCPESNANIASGIAPISKYLDEGLKVGIGSDVAGGSSTLMFREMRLAIEESKLRWRVVDQNIRPLTFPEVFYMATKGGGEFFGRVGSFEKGYEFDALIVDDFSLSTVRELSAAERAERLIYLGDDRNVTGKYVRGERIY